MKDKQNEFTAKWVEIKNVKDYNTKLPFIDILVKKIPYASMNLTLTMKEHN